MSETLESCLLCSGDGLRQVDAVAQLAVCEDCGYLFNNPRPSAAEVMAFYSRPAKYDRWIDDEEPRDILWRRRLAKLEEHAVPGNILDVGTGIGQFLHHASSVFESVQGTEVSSEAIRVARERYQLDVLPGEVTDIDLPDGAFDNITMFHVLEHVHDPKLAIRACHRLLRDGGRLFIAVPNDRALVTRSRGLALWCRGRLAKRLDWNVPQPTMGRLGLPVLNLDGEVVEIHLSHFTAPVLSQFLTREHFKIIDLGIDPYYVASGLKLKLHEAAYRSASVLARRDLYLYPTLWVAAEKA